MFKPAVSFYNHGFEGGAEARAIIGARAFAKLLL